MHERDRKSFLRFFLIFDSSLTFVNESDFMNLLFRSFLLRKLRKLSFDGPSNDEISNRFKSLSVCEVFSARTSLIKSGWLFSNGKEEVLCLIKVFVLHALTCGNELGRTAKEWCLKMFVYVPPERSSRNSSSSEEFMRSSARDDWRERDWEKFYKITFMKFHQTETWLTWFKRLLGGERLFHKASSWSKCCDWAKAACSGLLGFCCDPMLFISAIFEISSMLVDTENLRLSLSSTWAIMTLDVKCAYFFCHEYVSSESSFLSSRRAGRFAAAGRKSAKENFLNFPLRRIFAFICTFNIPRWCRVRRKFNILRRWIVQADNGKWWIVGEMHENPWALQGYIEASKLNVEL